MNRAAAARLLAIAVALVAWGGAPETALAQSSQTSAGPGRIFCRSSTSCELDIGTPASLKYNIDPSALAAGDKDRLIKQCTPKAAPCVATVTGTDPGTIVKAATIKFYN
jgi:hypothetical protein